MTAWQLLSMLVGFAILGPVFMLPTLVAISRKHPKMLLIALFNGMFAWTVLGWVALLIWATIPPKKPVAA
jgi:hypothetical protein